MTGERSKPTRERPTLSHDVVMISFAARWTLMALSSTAAVGFSCGGFLLGRWYEAMRRDDAKAGEDDLVPPKEEVRARAEGGSDAPTHHLLLSAEGTVAQLAGALQAMSLALELKAATASWSNADLGCGEFDLLTNPKHARVSNQSVIRAAAMGFLDVFDHEDEAESSASRMEGDGISGASET